MKNTSDILNKILFAANQSVKTASEPQTSHPTGKADPNNMAPTEGGHGKAVTAQVKKDQPLGPDSTSKPTNSGLGAPGAPINATRSETEDDVPAAGTKQVDPGTSHPAEAGKTASLAQTTADLVASIHDLVKQASAAPEPTPAAPAAPVATPAGTTKQAGAAAAQTALQEAALDPEFVKTAGTLRAQAEVDADTLLAFVASMEKQAMDEAGMAAGPVTEGAPPAAGAAPAGAEGAPAGGDPGAEDAVMQMIDALLAAGVTEEEIQAVLEGGGGVEALQQMYEQLQGAAAAPAEAAPAPEAGAEKMASAVRVKMAHDKVARAVAAIRNAKRKG